MKKITKGKEPKEWTEYCATPGVKYQSIPELCESLLQEQGYICAYCMRRISDKYKDKNSNEYYRIDHIQSRKTHPELQLKYGNMVICCPGAITNEFHCDKSKDKKDITFSLFDDSFISTLTYSTKDGTIKSSNADWDKEINDILNLNHPLLKENRKNALELDVVIYIKKWDNKTLKKKLIEWESKDINGKFKPYCGYVIWFLNKKFKSKSL